jgi:hypothetical protein
VDQPAGRINRSRRVSLPALNSIATDVAAFWFLISVNLHVPDDRENAIDGFALSLGNDLEALQPHPLRNGANTTVVNRNRDAQIETV